MSTEAQDLTREEYELFRKLVYAHSGINLGDQKRHLVRAKLGKRVRSGGFKSFRAYYQCSDASPARNEIALKAIELGAVEVVAKPAVADRRALHQLGVELADKIRAAAVAIKRPPPILPGVASEPITFRQAGLDPAGHLVAIAASTGGTEAIKNLLSNVPADFPPTAIVQHMPEGFTHSFAARLDHFSRLTITEAVDGDVMTPGRAFLARGGVQMTVRRSAGKWRIAYSGSELVNRHCPSADVLFDSLSRATGVQTVGILLTGMGNDGARGLLSMRQAGAVTIAQDRRSSVVYGMPKVAVELGAAEFSAPPSQIPALLLHALRERQNTAAFTR
jgi:two-component system chemotaxis response regulator CheB